MAFTDENGLALMECRPTFMVLTDEKGLLPTEFMKLRGEAKKLGARNAISSMLLSVAPPEFIEQSGRSVDAAAPQRTTSHEDVGVVERTYSREYEEKHAETAMQDKSAGSVDTATPQRIPSDEDMVVAERRREEYEEKHAGAAMRDTPVEEHSGEQIPMEHFVEIMEAVCGLDPMAFLSISSRDRGFAIEMDVWRESGRDNCDLMQRVKMGLKKSPNCKIYVNLEKIKKKKPKGGQQQGYWITKWISTGKGKGKGWGKKGKANGKTSRGVR
eukprot:GEMP01075770.1.p1 GENE.GEMP01075770.1~~GEMP01075770.1.p1  ORF type:complete len:289 (+),score=77.24 GEMP01075770.1:57-869(+)